MVCPRCIAAVKGVFSSLKIKVKKVELGEVHLAHFPNFNEIEALQTLLHQLGFEIVRSAQEAIISQIKSLIIGQVHHKQEPLSINFSVFLSGKLNHEYAYLSRLFSSKEGITIEKFITTQRIERVKELLAYNQLNLSQIALDMNYSSVAYLSSQFKKETGITPSQFKKKTISSRTSIDKL